MCGGARRAQTNDATNHQQMLILLHLLNMSQIILLFISASFHQRLSGGTEKILWHCHGPDTDWRGHDHWSEQVTHAVIMVYSSGEHVYFKVIAEFCFVVIISVFICRYALASHFLWGLWSIIQAKISKIEFGYMVRRICLILIFSTHNNVCHSCI